MVLLNDGRVQGHGKLIKFALLQGCQEVPLLNDSPDQGPPGDGNVLLPVKNNA